MSSSDWFSIPSRPHLNVDGELLDEGFVKNAIDLADQDPQRSGAFFSEFLAGYYKQVALGKCSDIGDSVVRGVPNSESIDWNVRRDMYLGASQAYHQCYRLRGIYESLDAVLPNATAYLQSILQSLRYAYEEQALLAAWRIRHIKAVGKLYQENKGKMLSLRGE